MKNKETHLIPSRLAKRAIHETHAIYSILDEALFCTISYVHEGPFSIPTGYVRYLDKIYIHGSVGSHFILAIAKGIPVCISVTLMDSIVIAKSAFHHSVNYRSVIIFANGENITEGGEKTEAFDGLPIWSGLFPFQKGFNIPQSDDLSKDIPLPIHLKKFKNLLKNNF